MEGETGSVSKTQLAESRPCSQQWQKLSLSVRQDKATLYVDGEKVVEEHLGWEGMDMLKIGAGNIPRLLPFV